MSTRTVKVDAERGEVMARLSPKDWRLLYPVLDELASGWGLTALKHAAGEGTPWLLMVTEGFLQRNLAPGPRKGPEAGAWASSRDSWAFNGFKVLRAEWLPGDARPGGLLVRVMDETHAGPTCDWVLLGARARKLQA